MVVNRLIMELVLLVVFMELLFLLVVVRSGGVGAGVRAGRVGREDNRAQVGVEAAVGLASRVRLEVPVHVDVVWGGWMRVCVCVCEREGVYVCAHTAVN